MCSGAYLLLLAMEIQSAIPCGHLLFQDVPARVIHAASILYIRILLVLKLRDPALSCLMGLQQGLSINVWGTAALITPPTEWAYVSRLETTSHRKLYNGNFSYLKP